MKKYSEHFLMDTDTVKQYIIDSLDYFEDENNLVAEEIGDGNINYVFKVYDKSNNKSLVVKQADKLLRSSGRPLDLNRNKIEAEILKIESELAPGFVPEIYDYNENMYALVMEDISEYKNLRKELKNSKIFPKLADDISTFLVNTLLLTTDLYYDRHEKKNKVKEFVNIDLCDISEDLVFTEPYYDYKNRNILTEGIEEFVKENLYKDEQLKCEVGLLRNNFMNNAQSLIHGDLHSGSIFINENGLKVIDPEFAFYGPMGYDIGNVIGNLFFSLANKYYTESYNTDFIYWIEKTIVDIYDLFKKKFELTYKEKIDFPIYNELFMHKYLSQVMADSAGYAGTEIIRRTVGDSKVMEISDVHDKNIRIKLEQTLINLGIKFIKNRESYSTGSELIEEFRKVAK